MLAFLIFWRFIYLPMKNDMIKKKIELSGVESQIKQIETIFGKTSTEGESIRFLRERFQGLDNKFPTKEEAALKKLSDFAKKLNVEIISLKPNPKEMLTDENDSQIKIEGKTCQRVFLTLNMRCNYEDLVKYIESVKADLPAFVTIEKIKINKSKSERTRLNVVLEINLYLLS